MRRAILLVVGACSWTQFDDLANKTWVHAQDRPGTTAATDFGVAVAPGAPSQAQGGGRLVVLGNGQPDVDVISFDASGKTSSLVQEFRIATSGILVYQPNPPLLLKPHTAARANEVALVANGSDGTTRVVLAQGLDTPTPTSGTPLIVPNTPATDGATYIVPPGAGVEQMLVGSGGTAIGFDLTTQAANRCALADETGQPITIAALAALVTTTGGTSDSLVVWATNGKLYEYAGNVWNGCATQATPLGPGADVGFSPGTGARIDVATGTLVVLAAEQAGANGGPNDTASRVVAYDLATPTPKLVAMPFDTDGVIASAVATFGTTQYAILGFPERSANGTSGAGEVELHALDATSGVEAAPTVTLYRAQPDANGAFGRAVSTMSFNGQTILVVGSAGYVFAYYELDPQYPDTRQ